LFGLTAGIFVMPAFFAGNHLPQALISLAIRPKSVA
jgi:hypothetical protein